MGLLYLLLLSLPVVATTAATVTHARIPTTGSSRTANLRNVRYGEPAPMTSSRLAAP